MATSSVSRFSEIVTDERIQARVEKWFVADSLLTVSGSM
jgi:hypothetical protein